MALAVTIFIADAERTLPKLECDSQRHLGFEAEAAHFLGCHQRDLGNLLGGRVLIDFSASAWIGKLAAAGKVLPVGARNKSHRGDGGGRRVSPQPVDHNPVLLL
jgi:hypothetical protein